MNGAFRQAQCELSTMIPGIRPGPLLIPEHPEVFWAWVASMYLGNIMLLVIKIPLIGIWVQILRIPSRVLLPLILLFCIPGAYSIRNTFFDVGMMMLLGALGYLMEKFEYERAPLALAFVLGPIYGSCPILAHFLWESQASRGLRGRVVQNLPDPKKRQQE